MTALRITLQVLLVITSLLLVPLVLLHKGKGGGLSDMFGGGITASAGSSGVAERNLNRITVAVALLWAIFIVVLGLITSKSGELENKDAIKRRFEEASKFAPLDQLALSPQCGFASTEEGNTLTEDQQWAKMREVIELADEVWGK